jgi:basic membrane protein A
VQGVIAGKLSKAGLAGYVGSVPVPEVVQGINAFMLGMQSINPKARMKFVLINSWYDPPKEGDAAKALIDQGATSSPSTPTRRRRCRPPPAAGSRHSASPPTCRSSRRHRTQRQHRRLGAVLHQADRRCAGWHLEKHRHLGRLRQRHAGHVAVHQHAAGRRGAGDATVADITSGKNKVFVGPIMDQSGATKVPAGTTMDDGALSGMQWLVQGVDGKS